MNPNTKYTKKNMIDIAKERSGRFLSKDYTVLVRKYVWGCNICKSQWEATASDVKSGSWCPRCAGKRKTIGDLYELVKDRKITCLESIYKGSTYKYKWKCKECNKCWRSIYPNIAMGEGCPHCSGSVVTLSEVKRRATSLGLKYLSSSYTNNRKKEKWKSLKCNHEWSASTSNIFHGFGCPYCAGKKYTISDIRKLGKKNGLILKSKNFLGVKTKHLWECERCGDEWEVIPYYIKKRNSKNCPKCVASTRYTISDLKNFAKSKKGKCLSDKYDGHAQSYLWECSKGHSWKAKFSYVKKNWCEKCSRIQKELLITI
jgi:Zn finger protein HypA/HybF involved in hydrogenase expression